MTDLPDDLISLELDQSIWDRFFTVAPMVVVGTRGVNGSQDLFATHRGFPMGPENLFAFLAAPESGAVVNAVRIGEFGVSFLRPDQVVEASLAASERESQHPLLAEIPTFPASRIGSVLVSGAHAHLECRVDRIIEDLGSGVLVMGRVVAAHVDRGARRLSDRDDCDVLANHPLLAFVAPGRFAKIDQTDAFPKAE